MKQIFVFTAGNPEARKHLDDSIINPVKAEVAVLMVPAEGVEPTHPHGY